MLSYAAAHPVLYSNLKRIRAFAMKRALNVSILRSDEPVPFASLDDAAFRPVGKRISWGRKLSCAWFKLEGVIPSGINDPVILVKTNAEGLVYTPDGTPYASVSGVRADLPSASGAYRVIELPAAVNRRVELYMDCGYNGFMGIDLLNAEFGGAFFADRSAESCRYYYDYLALFLLAASTKDSALRADVTYALLRSFEAYNAGGTRLALELLGAELKRPSVSEFTFRAVGHGHLDLAWLWPERETKRKSARTYLNALKNIEKYPEYIYGTSQPQQLAWMKELYPDVYRRVKQAIIDGRIEMQGGFWCECDCNLTGGESLIRQAVYGRRFTEDEFGKSMKICWLPDAFGFNASLPQILRGCGMEYFSTIKLSWNKVNVFPYRTFEWRGIDGSCVTAHMPPEGNYNSCAGAHSLLKAFEKYPERELGTALLVYGAGDGGGGPGETHLEMLTRQKDLRGLPKVEFSSAAAFFERLGVPPHNYTGELYLETHQGTYTTQAKIKYYNRLCERLLHNAECLAAIDGAAYPYEFFEKTWKQVLLYQFHDILPGSSINRVNRETVGGYRELKSALSGKIDELLNGTETAAFANLTSFPRDEYIKRENTWYHARLEPYSSGLPAAVTEDFDCLRHTDDAISNGRLTLRFGADGSIASCKDAAGCELSCGYLNRLTLYTDIPVDEYNAWNIESGYRKRPRKRLAVSAHTAFIDGPLVIRVNEYRFGKSKLTQRVILEAGSDTVTFRTVVSWHETFKMLRADFRPSDFGKIVKCDIPFGHINRPTTENTPVERAQFEVCAHKWAAVMGKGRGFALLNDSKYGHRVKNGLLSLNLLRSPIFPDRTADRGRQEFTYAFCPFQRGKLIDVIREGYRLNNPLIPSRRCFDSAARVSGQSVVLETVKRAERGDGIILRLYECLGKPAKVSVDTSVPHREVWLTDMLENRVERTDLKDISFKPFEIKTILLDNAKPL